MARDTSLRETKTWRVVTLSTGEVPMEAKLSELGGPKATRGGAGPDARYFGGPRKGVRGL